MDWESNKEQMARIGELPALSDWLKKIVLLYRCQDIDKKEFLKRVHSLHHKIEELFQQSLPESMEEETYLVAQEYYDAAAEALDYYLNGLETLLDWTETGSSKLLDATRLHFSGGDERSRKVIALAFEVHKSFREADEALMSYLGMKPEGID